MPLYPSVLKLIEDKISAHNVAEARHGLTTKEYLAKTNRPDQLVVPKAELFATKPTAEQARAGEIIRVRTGAGAKAYLYVCVQNSTNTWEWVQIALST